MLLNKISVKTILNVAKNLFVVSLIIYLVLFLLEITFTGFVSNNFNLNSLLVMVLLLGVFAACAPEEPEEDSPFVKSAGGLRQTDYLMFIGMGILGGLLMFFKSDLNLVPRILFSLFIAGFITAVSLYLLLAKDEEILEELETSETNHPTNLVLPQIRRLLIKPIKVPLGVVMIGLILLGLSLIQPKRKPQAPRVITNQPTENKAPIALFFLDRTEDLLQPSLQELKDTPISILNGSPKVGSASAMAKFLTTKDFTIGRVDDADRADYQNAIVQFRPEEQTVAEWLVDKIQGIYPIVERAPLATDSGEIILILGTQKP